ncbi:seed lectin subunit I-like [Humulus lupulus]|uniref:seed lectin subunit I-like n=1 Tax=Humulus lupulus TaxID=3486 RepID=UPI002B417DAC|nr:seed lectin subunit I-like [Humulus lupulus]
MKANPDEHVIDTWKDSHLRKSTKEKMTEELERARLQSQSQGPTEGSETESATESSSIDQYEIMSKVLIIFLLIIFYVILNQASMIMSSIVETNDDDPKMTFFSFPSFNPESCINGDLLCMGSVSIGNTTNYGHYYLNLTPEPPPPNSTTTHPTAKDKIGRVLYRQPVVAWPAMISTTFTVRISPFPNSSVSGDGIAFVFAQDNKPSPPRSFGSYLGLLDRSTQGGVIQQLAVELDTYMNEFDIDGNHMGIVTTSIINPVIEKSLNSTGIELKSGRDIKVKIDYDGLDEILSVYVGYSENPLVSFFNRSITISDKVPRSVYVGFTASTGTLPETHQILDWVFTSVPLTTSFVAQDYKNSIIKTILVITIPVSIVLSIVLSGVFVLVLRLFLKRNNDNKKNREDIESRSRSAANVPKMFTYKELSKATHGFSRENLLGTGGFGSVYKGTIILDHQPQSQTIAVKKISSTSKQGLPCLALIFYLFYECCYLAT